MIQTLPNGVKPRFDNGGSEFGLMHRGLGPGYLMFDIDRMYANVEVEISLRREDEGFVEYRRHKNSIEFVAMMEVKKHRTSNSEQALNKDNTNSLARIEIARRLGCRLFVVFATNGRQPFTFYEIDTESGDYIEVGTLDYENGNRDECVKAFWRDVLQITR